MKIIFCNFYDYFKSFDFDLMKKINKTLYRKIFVLNMLEQSDFLAAIPVSDKQEEEKIFPYESMCYVSQQLTHTLISYIPV